MRQAKEAKVGQFISAAARERHDVVDGKLRHNRSSVVGAPMSYAGIEHREHKV